MISKITYGFVIQVFDEENQKWVSQEFVASDECNYEDKDGSPVSSINAYLPFEMVQPEQ